MSKPAVIISTDFNLTESQNFLRYSKTQNRLLSVAFLLHALTSGLSLFALAAAALTPSLREFINSRPLAMFLVGTLMLLVAYVLGFSKVCARKVPVNYLCLLLFEGSLSYSIVAADVLFAEGTLHVFVSLLCAAALANLAYVASLADYYSGLTGFLLSFGVMIPLFCLFGFLHQREFLLLAAHLTLAILLTFLACVGVERLMKNRDYYLLKDDYVLVAFKIITVVPLIPQLLDEDRTGEDD